MYSDELQTHPKRTRSWILCLLVILALSQIPIFLFLWKNNNNNVKKPQTRLLNRKGIFQKADATGDYLNVCVPPEYDYWHPDISGFIDLDFDPKDGCDKQFVKYTDLINGTWSITVEKEGLDCSARCVTDSGESSVNHGEWMKPGRVDCEFLEAVCWEKSRQVYGYMHTQVIPKQLKVAEKKEQANVFVLLLDSMSTGQAKRQLPKTLSHLKNNMDAVEFPYVNVVGVNSRPNGFPLFFGKMMENARNKIQGAEDFLADWAYSESCSKFLDNESSLFSDFRDAGYATQDADDWAATFVNFPNCKGFRNPPTHHHMHPLILNAETLGEYPTREHLKGTTMCREPYHVAVEYFEQFVKAYPDSPKFSFTWISHPGHDYFNGLARMDKVLLKMMENNREVLDNSFFLLMGDHGPRVLFDKQEYQKHEMFSFERFNPYLAMTVPKKYRKSAIYDKMMENSKQLQTHFDTRATLLDILKFQTDFSDTSPLDIPDEKGHSYLRQRPDYPRTCARLPIPMEYCICQTEMVPVEDERFKRKLGELMLKDVHETLKKAKYMESCVEHQLKQVTSLLHFGPFNETAPFHNYRIIVEAEAPSRAVLETAVHVDSRTGKAVFDKTIRVDEYGDTTNCINDNSIGFLCHCKYS